MPRCLLAQPGVVITGRTMQRRAIKNYERRRRLKPQVHCHSFSLEQAVLIFSRNGLRRGYSSDRTIVTRSPIFFSGLTSPSSKRIRQQPQIPARQNTE